MKTLDFTKTENTFHPKLLALMEKAHVKQVSLSFDDHYRLDRVRRFWTTDYPLLSYIQDDRRHLVMVHLADPDLGTNRKNFIHLGENEEFVSFVERSPMSCNASISCLLKIDGVINLRTYEYSKPFEKKEFKNDIYWLKKN